MTGPQQPVPQYPPHGYPPRLHNSRPAVSKQNRIVTIIAIAFAGLAISGILAAVAINGTTSTTAGDSNVIAVTYTPPPTGRSGDLEFQVLQTSSGLNAAGGGFVSVTVKVTNVGKAGEYFDPDAPYIFDAQERMYNANEAETFGDHELNPGLSITRTIAYTVPPGTTPTMFSASAGWGVPFVRIALPPQG